MALADFIVNLNGGDTSTADTLLTYKIYGNLDSYTTPIAVKGSHISDPNVTVSNGIATITSVDVGLNVSFKIKTVDESLNESLISDEYITLHMTPVLSNFRVENAQPNRVYFDASDDVTGITKTGFYVSGRGEPSSVTVDVDGLGGYFTLASGFTFWDNNTIRLEGGNGVVEDFTLTYIDNQINEPSASSYRYVEVGASGNGLTISTPASLTYAVTYAVSGQTWWIKAGNYGSLSLTVANNGSSTAPIKFIGYKTATGGVPDVISSNYYNPETENWSTAEMPTITGAARTAGTALTINTKSNIIVKNIQATNSLHGFWMYRNSNVVMERCNAKSFGTDAGQAFYLEGILTGDFYNNVSTKVINCVAKNACDNGMSFFGDYMLVKDSKIYQNEGATTQLAMDYYLTVRGNNNIAINNWVKRTSTPVHTGYVGIKSGEDNGSEVGSEYNLFCDNQIYGIARSLMVRNAKSNYNVLKDNYVEGLGTGSTSMGNGGGIAMFGGIKYNVWERNIIKNVGTQIQIWANGEDFYETNKVMENNIIRNNIFDGARNIFLGQNDDFQYHQSYQCNNNKFYNNTFKNVNGYFYSLYTTNGSWTMSNNLFTNNIFNSITNYSDPDPDNDVVVDFDFDYNLFYTGMSAQGTNAITGVNPALNASYEPTVAFTSIDVPKIAGVTYDYNKSQRMNQTTVGAVKHADESSEEVINIPATPTITSIVNLATATFEINLNGGDTETADYGLYFKIYGSANGYATPIVTTGTDIADANVSTAAGIATIENVDIGTETMFKVGVVDADENESILSATYTLTTELFTFSNAASINNEANAITGITNQTHTSPSSISSDKSPNGGSYSIQVDQTVGGSNKRSVFTLSVTNGKTYRITYDAKKLQSGGDAGVGNGFGGEGWNAANFIAATTSWVSYSQDWVANITGTATVFLYPSYTVSGSIGDKLLVDRISIIELP